MQLEKEKEVELETDSQRTEFDKALVLEDLLSNRSFQVNFQS